MGIWSTLAGLGGIVAAPFTGGASLLGTLGSLGQVAGSAAANAGKGRLDEALLNVSRDRNALDAYQTGLALPKIRTADAVRASLLSQMQDATTTPPAGARWTVPQSSGGLRPSVLAPEARQVGADQLRKTLMAQLTNAGPPQQTAMPEAGLWEKLGQGVGIGGSLFGALAQKPSTLPTLTPKRPPQTLTPYPGQ